MENQGLVQYPVVIRKDQPKGSGLFMLISGERRWRAAKRSNGKIPKLPCIIRKDIKEADIFELSMVENRHRQPLDPIEDAKSIKKLMDLKHYSVPEAAERMGTSTTQIYLRLKLLDLPPEIQKGIAQRKISPVHVSGMHSITDEKIKIKVAREIIKKNLSGKQTQDLIIKTMAEGNQKFSDGRTAKEVAFEKNFKEFANSVTALSDLYDFWVKLDNPSQKNFLETIQKDKKLLRDLHYARTLLEQIGEKVD